jgi:hypothetical protein
MNALILRITIFILMTKSFVKKFPQNFHFSDKNTGATRVLSVITSTAEKKLTRIFNYFGGKAHCADKNS